MSRQELEKAVQQKLAEMGVQEEDVERISPKDFLERGDEILAKLNIQREEVDEAELDVRLNAMFEAVDLLDKKAREFHEAVSQHADEETIKKLGDEGVALMSDAAQKVRHTFAATGLVPIVSMMQEGDIQQATKYLTLLLGEQGQIAIAVTPDIDRATALLKAMSMLKEAGFPEDMIAMQMKPLAEWMKNGNKLPMSYKLDIHKLND